MNCGECDYCNKKLYCERLGIYVRENSPICEYFIGGTDGNSQSKSA